MLSGLRETSKGNKLGTGDRSVGCLATKLLAVYLALSSADSVHHIASQKRIGRPRRPCVLRGDDV